MKIYDGRKIIPGILIAAVIFCFPFWLNFGKAAVPPKIKLPKEVKNCVKPTAFMRTSHMELLNRWRDIVVRQNERIFVAPDGKEYAMSLQNGCLKCHGSKAEFCDQCHNYLDVKPYCWDCHLAPKENK